MVEAWYYDDADTSSPQQPHKFTPNQPVSIAQLQAIGVFHAFIDTAEPGYMAKIDALCLERNYKNRDEVRVARDKLPNYDEKIKMFFEEHLHDDEEIRFVLGGSGYFDCRSVDDRWIRISVVPGDLIVLPAGIFHRFTVDSHDYIHAMRLFQDEPKWTPVNRNAEAEACPSHLSYKETVGSVQVVLLGGSANAPAHRFMAPIPSSGTSIQSFIEHSIAQQYNAKAATAARKECTVYTAAPDFAVMHSSASASLLEPGSMVLVVLSGPLPAAKHISGNPFAEQQDSLALATSQREKREEKEVYGLPMKIPDFSPAGPPTAQKSAAQGNSGHPPARAPRKRVLLVGINYTGMAAELKGCCNDVKNCYKLVTTRWGYKDGADMKVLTDDQRDPARMPTKKNIMDALHWLVQDAFRGDHLYLHYSGHGSQQAEDGDDFEEDGLDDTLVPLDYQEAGQIVDDDLNDILVKSLPEGVKLTVFMDCCHSGSIMDMPYSYDASCNMTFNEKMGTKGAGSADVVMISGCMETQTSADAKIAGMATGAMSYALLKTIQTKGVNLTYRELLTNLRRILKKKGYTQVPQLTASREVFIDGRFAP
ncbi:MAG: hypothetical protein SGCHY_002250 [Lobulomycetales sp.]